MTELSFDFFNDVLAAPTDFAEKWRGPIAAAAHRLIAQDVKQALLLCEDSEVFTAGMLALLYAGVDVILPPNMRPDTLQNLRSRIPDTFTDNDLIMGQGAALPERDITGGMIIFHTSGTLGASKPIDKSVLDLQDEAIALNTMFPDQTPGSPVFGMVPHYHLFGMTFRIVWPLLSRRRIIGKTWSHWENLLAELTPGATIVPGPAFLERMGGLEPLGDHLRPAMVISGGAPLSNDATGLAKKILGTAVTEFFGSTETGVIATRPRNGDAPPWTPLPGPELRLEDGELVVGEIRLADKVTFLADGHFEFSGRGDRIVKIEAVRVNLSNLETRLKTFDEVDDASVLLLENKIGAVVKLTAVGKTALEASGKFRFERGLRQTLARNLEEASVPRRWRFVDQIPMDRMAKRPAGLLAQLFDDDLPMIQSVLQDEDSVKLSLFIPRSLKWFNGHFPDAPILAGVVQLDWAVQFAARYFELVDLAPQKFKVKYRNVILPDSAVELALHFNRDKQRLEFQFESDAGVHSSGSCPVT